MTMVPYTNTTDRIQHVGGKMIHPGETRDVPASALPGAGGPVGFDDLHDLSPEATGHAELIALLKGTVSEIEKALAGLSDAQLDALIELEGKDGSPRKGVLAAVEHERLRRAADGLAEGGEA